MGYMTLFRLIFLEKDWIWLKGLGHLDLAFLFKASVKLSKNYLVCLFPLFVDDLNLQVIH